MTKQFKNDSWVWTIVMGPAGNEQILGQQHKEQNISFIPFFSSKEDAEQCAPGLEGLHKNRYEAQAIIFEDLLYYAKENSMMMFLLNEKGDVLDQVAP